MRRLRQLGSRFARLKGSFHQPRAKDLGFDQGADATLKGSFNRVTDEHPNGPFRAESRRPTFPGLRPGLAESTLQADNLEESDANMKKAKSTSSQANVSDSSAQPIDARITDLGDWRAEMLARIRILIKQADPEAVEEVKWRKPSNPMGVRVWSHAGMICTGETYKDKVKLTFAKGASLTDGSGLFNSSLEGNTRRAIDFHEDDKINEKALKALICAAVALNTSTRPNARPVRSPKRPKRA